jgi:putative transposase
MHPTFRRKNIRLPRDYYVGLRRYFVTTVCADRQPLLSHAATAHGVIDVLRETSQHHGFATLAYCAMPDHLHFLAVGLTESSNLLNFVMHFKRRTTIAHAERLGTRLWQKKFFDHILRESEANSAVAFYVRMNPVRAGLCDDPWKYEFAGAFSDDWSDLHAESPWTPPWRA